jgi:hypothetical protein
LVAGLAPKNAFLALPRASALKPRKLFLADFHGAYSAGVLSLCPLMLQVSAIR